MIAMGWVACVLAFSLHELNFFVTCREIDQLLKAREPGLVFLCAGHPSCSHPSIVGRKTLKVFPSHRLFLEPCFKFFWHPRGHGRSLETAREAERRETGGSHFSFGTQPFHPPNVGRRPTAVGFSWSEPPCVA